MDFISSKDFKNSCLGFVQVPKLFVLVMAVGVVGFLKEITKLERFLHKNQHTQRKCLNFENWCNGEVSKSALI